MPSNLVDSFSVGKMINLFFVSVLYSFKDYFSSYEMDKSVRRKWENTEKNRNFSSKFQFTEHTYHIFYNLPFPYYPTKSSEIDPEGRNVHGTKRLGT